MSVTLTIRCDDCGKIGVQDAKNNMTALYTARSMLGRIGWHCPKNGKDYCKTCAPKHQRQPKGATPCNRPSTTR